MKKRVLSTYIMLLSKEAQYALGISMMISPLPDYEKAHDYLSKVEAQGVVNAACYLGILAEYRLDVAINLDEALQAYQRAAASGYPLAQILLGMCYQLGIGGCAVDDKQAEVLFEQASLALEHCRYSERVLGFFERLSRRPGHFYARASVLLSIVHERGLLGVERDEAEAMIWKYRAMRWQGYIEKKERKFDEVALKKASQVFAATDDTAIARKRAQILGVDYLGLDLRYSIQEVIDVLWQSAKEKKTKHAKEALKQLADEGNPHAQYAYGVLWMLSSNAEIASDGKYEQAYRYLSQAVEQGYKPARCYFGLLYEYGCGVSASLAKAVMYYENKGSIVSPLGQILWGLCYLRGLRQTHDNIRKAKDLFDKAYSQGKKSRNAITDGCYIELLSFLENQAERKQLGALALLAIAYKDGLLGVEKDSNKAYIYFTRIKDMGKEAAWLAWNLGDMYRIGLWFEKNWEQASQWWLLAATYGGASEMRALSDLLEDMGKKDEGQQWLNASKDAEKQGNISLAPCIPEGPDESQRMTQSHRCKEITEKDLSYDGYSLYLTSDLLSNADNPDAGAEKEKEHNDLNRIHPAPYKDITLGRLLGRGGYGEVFEGDWHGEKVAVKQLFLHKMSEEALNEFKQEAKIMASLDFEYIVTFKGMCVDPDPYSLVMEYMSGGSLYGVLHSPDMLPWSTRHRIAWNVAKGLAFLHRQKPLIIHRDLKSHNVLLTADYQCAKLTDFGISSIRKESATFIEKEFCGSLSWTAPECLENKYSVRSDIYSYGMILWELVSRKIPYQELAMPAILGKLMRGECEDIPDEMTQLSPDRPTAKTPQSIQKFIRLCWFQERAKRPTAQQAVEAFEQDIERELAPEYSDHENVQMTNTEGKEPESPQRPSI